MRVLVTGSNGFIGSFLAASLLERGDQVKCLVRKTSNLRWLEGLDVEYAYGELDDPESLINAAVDCKVIFHLAGVTKARDKEGYMRGNYQGTLNLLNAVKTVGNVKKFVYVSSQAAGGPSLTGRPRNEKDKAGPISLYGFSKIQAEEAVMDFADSFPVTIIRPPSVYGPRDKDVYQMFKQINRGLYPVLGDGQNQASLVHVDDLVRGILLAADNPHSNSRTYYISGDGDYNWLKIGSMIAYALHRKPLTVHIPHFALDLVSWTSIGLSYITKKPALLNRDKVREMKQASWLCSNQRAKDELGFIPKISAQKGLAHTADWYRAQGWL